MLVLICGVGANRRGVVLVVLLCRRVMVMVLLCGRGVLVVVVVVVCGLEEWLMKFGLILDLHFGFGGGRGVVVTAASWWWIHGWRWWLISSGYEKDGMNERKVKI